ncbi:class II aldolase/adducin family protein [Arthrobacter bambusae]|uniref:class II aldolase/adducin family protein n=1 Tax=unclassified Arthrobacter TaxID=235627 RepID=UPI00254A592E|nr:class II aldolase/adducin family protein [Arthrobacter sp. efr-133-R2A-120]
MSHKIADDIVRLCRTLGEPGRDLVILAEGNVSGRATPETMFVKASGANMATATRQDLVEVRLAPLLALLNDDTADDETVARVLMESLVDSEDKRPSVEALLHAVCQEYGETPVVAHTHPVSVNALLCSDQATELVSGTLFPDQVVVLGKRQLLIPYTDPGLQLARSARRELQRHIAAFGGPPKALYLVNHGMFALGQSATEALQITEMAVKCARIIGGALSIGNTTHLSEPDAERIDSRPDEHLRRKELLSPGGPHQ